MAITRERFDEVRKRWGAYSSWAVWHSIGPEDKPKAHAGDITSLDPDKKPSLLSLLNPDVVLLGLNAATRPIPPEPWSNFHDSRAVANDFKIRFALADSPYAGAYMTDVLVGLHETDSNKVATYMRANPTILTAQIERLEEELNDIGATNPLLIAFGGAAHKALREHLGHKYRIVKVTHYVHRIKKEQYREGALAAIAAGSS